MRNRLRRPGGFSWLPLIFLLVLGGCSAGWASTWRPAPSLLFHHDWHGRDAAVLAQLLANFQLVRPDLYVVAESRTPDELTGDFAGDFAGNFAASFAQGTEPDVVLTDALTAQELIRQGLVKELSQYGFDKSRFNAAALTMVSDGDRLYGAPFALSTQLLFYNRAVVPEPPTTIAELETITRGPDVVMGLNTSFQGAFWGLGAFGARSAGDRERLTLDAGPLVNWLTVLTSIQGEAGFVLSDDQDQLRAGFLAGETDLYVADADEIDLLVEGLGEQLGVAALPAGSDGSPASPLLEAGILLISANADEQQTAAALELIGFLTNSQQQSLLTLGDIGRIAAVNTVYVSPSMPDVIVALAAQLGSAVPITLAQRDAWDQLAVQGRPLYRAVLEGVIDEQAAAGGLARYMREPQGLPPDPPATAALCPPLDAARPLIITVWHDWSPADTPALAELALEFHSLCPGVAISLTAAGNSTTLNTRFRAAAAAGGGPDVLIGSTEWMALLAQDGLIRALGDALAPGELSSFVPSAVSAVHYAGEIYAYPEAVDNLALFYNPTLVESPAQTLHELLLQVNAERGFAMPLDFYYAYWGLGAFGSRMFADAEPGAPLAADEGAAAWLTWLAEAARRPGFRFTVGRAEAEQAFIDRKAAYLVAGAWSLPRLRAALPPKEIAVALLPSGPRNRAVPLLEVEGFMVNRAATPAAFAGGLAFARYVAGAHGAAAILATGVQAPANVTVDVSSVPVIGGMIDQAQLAEGVVQDRAWKEVERLGKALYRRVVLDGADVDAALAEFVEAANRVREATGEK